MRIPVLKKWIVVISVVLLGVLQFPGLANMIPAGITNFVFLDLSFKMILGILMFVSAYWVGRSETA
jgi:hypothetical protein